MMAAQDGRVEYYSTVNTPQALARDFCRFAAKLAFEMRLDTIIFAAASLGLAHQINADRSQSYECADDQIQRAHQEAH